MAAHMRMRTLFLVFLAIAAAYCTDYQPRAIQLTEETWQDILDGEWMVEFMAPWCPACRAFQDTWDGFAKKWSRDLDVKVATVDVTVNPGLSGRFLITALPSIYHVKNGVFRQYLGGRDEGALITFIDDKKWQDVEPVSKWTTPDSIQMGTVGQFFKLAMKIRALYTMMTEEYGIPEWGCYVIFAIVTILTGLLLGLLLVCLCDFMSSSTPSNPPPIPQDLMNQELDEEGDLIDDTPTEDGGNLRDDVPTEDGDATTRQRKVAKSEDKSKEDVKPESDTAKQKNQTTDSKKSK